MSKSPRLCSLKDDRTKAGTGLSLIAIVLILLTPICLGNSQLHTPDFYELSYYNAKTNQYATGQKDLCFVGFWIVLLTGMRAALMEYMLAPLAKRWGISTKKQQTRFAEQAWMIIYYNISWPIGLVRWRLGVEVVKNRD